MIHAAGGVDKQIDPFVFQHVLVILVGFQLRRRRDTVHCPAFPDGIRDGDHFVAGFECGVRFKQMTVNIPSAASLADDADSDSFHDAGPPL